MTNEKVKKLFDDIYLSKEKVITEELAKQVLTEYGVSVPKYALVTNEEEAEIEAAGRGGSPARESALPRGVARTGGNGAEGGAPKRGAGRKTNTDVVA